MHRVQQLEEENGDMSVNVSRLKSQSEKLDQVSQTEDRPGLQDTKKTLMLPFFYHCDIYSIAK